MNEGRLWTIGYVCLAVLLFVVMAAGVVGMLDVGLGLLEDAGVIER
jgi:hypothetical protein